MFSRCKNVLEVLYHRAKFGGARISPAAGVAKNVKFLPAVLVHEPDQILVPPRVANATNVFLKDQYP